MMYSEEKQQQKKNSRVSLWLRKYYYSKFQSVLFVKMGSAINSYIPKTFISETGKFETYTH